MIQFVKLKQTLKSGNSYLVQKLNGKHIEVGTEFGVFFFSPFSLQIQEFTSGFWSGTQLACWDKSENPWTLFPKISIYLRDVNSSQSFRITILPQVWSSYFTVINIYDKEDGPGLIMC